MRFVGRGFGHGDQVSHKAFPIQSSHLIASPDWHIQETLLLGQQRALAVLAQLQTGLNHRQVAIPF